MKDRAQQALHLLALDPVVETAADNNSYGFRQQRSCADAIEQVLRRDGWRCQCCGTKSNLEVHHKEFRSQGGVDSEENLITLCAACHERVHQPRRRSAT